MKGDKHGKGFGSKRRMEKKSIGKVKGERKEVISGRGEERIDEARSGQEREKEMRIKRIMNRGR